MPLKRLARTGTASFVALLLLASCRGSEWGANAASSTDGTSDAPEHRDILGIKKRQGKRVYSQHDEELIIRDFFQDRRDGVFLDVGCAWPKTYSNTYFLESELGWSGIGVDALPEYANGWKRDRPKSHFFNFIVTDHFGTSESFYRYEKSGNSSLTPTKKGAERPPRTQEITVPTITLTKLLDDNRVSKVDFVSMDIEGAEMLALAGFDIDRFHPEFVCIEWYHAGREKIMAYFQSHGYERIDRYIEADGVNDYYTPKPKSASQGRTSAF